MMTDSFQENKSRGGKPPALIICQYVPADRPVSTVTVSSLHFLKGTYARDFHSLFLNFFLHISVTNRYKTQSSQHFRKYSSNSLRYSKFSITRRFRRKREA
jgi:hypothetical protein